MIMRAGKYHGAQAAQALPDSSGRLCLVMIIEGPEAAAFDVACATDRPDLIEALPAILRAAADGIRDGLSTAAAAEADGLAIAPFPPPRGRDS